MGWFFATLALCIVGWLVKPWFLRYLAKRKRSQLKDKPWKDHPRYIADPGGLFGAPPRLQCVACDKNDWELFYGHCGKCADANSIPRKGLEPQDFHDQMGKGLPAVSSAFKE